MKFKGALISQLSGKLGGIVASTVKGGIQVFRRRPSASATSSDLQAQVRASMGSLAVAWSQTLTAAERAGWDLYALNVTVLNGQGESVHNSGFAWFVGNNIARLNAGLAIVTAAPTTFDVGNDAAMLPDNFTASTGTNGTLSLGFGTNTLSSVAEGDFLLVSVSTPFSPGRAEPTGPFNRVLTVPATSSAFASGPLPLSHVPQAGVDQKQKIRLRLTRSDGRLSQPIEKLVDAIV